MEKTIGTWNEAEARTITRCPSYYAADWETLETRPGQYPARVEFIGGFDCPMPYWLLTSIEADRVGGALYNGICGNNFSSQSLPCEPVAYNVQMYSYEIPALVRSGKLTLAAGFEWLTEPHAWKHPAAPKTWDDVKAMV